MNVNNRQEDSQQDISQINNHQHIETSSVFVTEGATGGAGPSSLSSDDEVPSGTVREERLVKKLKVIDVLSPKSSFDIADNEVDNIIQPAFRRINVNQRNNQQHTIGMDRFQMQNPPQKQHAQKTISFGGAISRSREPKSLPSRLTLLVNGTRFVVNPCIFTKYPNTLLGR